MIVSCIVAELINKRSLLEIDSIQTIVLLAQTLEGRQILINLGLQLNFFSLAGSLFRINLISLSNRLQLGPLNALGLAIHNIDERFYCAVEFIQLCEQRSM